MSENHPTQSDLFAEGSGSKKCGRCQEVKGIECFGKVKGKVRSYCRECHNDSVNTPDLRTHKRCADCKSIKPVTEFNRCGKRFQSYCKVCGLEASKQRYTAKKATGEATQEYRDYYWRRKKWTKMKCRYGIGRAEYEALHEAQEGRCAICRLPETDQWRGVQLELAVDHDHETGKIRGLLCRSCNLGIGKFRENIESLRRAADYLEKHKE